MSAAVDRRLLYSTASCLTFSHSYGELTLDWRRYETVVCVAGGVGVTPMIALLRAAYRVSMSEAARARAARGAFHTKTIVFVWSAPDHETYGWFKDVVDECLARSGVEVGST